MTCYLAFLPPPSIKPSVIKSDGLVDAHGKPRAFDLVRFDQLEDMPSSLESNSRKRRQDEQDNAVARYCTPETPRHARRPLAAYNTWSTGFNLPREPAAAPEDDTEQSFQELVTYGQALDDIPDRTDVNFRTTQATMLSTQISGWEPTQLSAASTTSSKRPRTRASIRPSMGLTLSQSDSSVSSMFPTQNQAGNASISALPGFPHIDPARLRPLSEFNDAGTVKSAAAPVTIMVAVLDVGETRHVRPPNGRRGRAGGSERSLAVCDVTVIQPLSTLTMAAKNVTTMTVTVWGDLVEDFVGQAKGLKKGDVVLMEDLAQKRKTRQDGTAYVALVASKTSGPPPRATVLFRSFPRRNRDVIQDDDRRLRPDVRMRKSESGLRRIFALAEWVYQNCHLFGQPRQERPFGE